MRSRRYVLYEFDSCKSSNPMTVTCSNKRYKCRFSTGNCVYRFNCMKVGITIDCSNAGVPKHLYHSDVCCDPVCV